LLLAVLHLRMAQVLVVLYRWRVAQVASMLVLCLSWLVMQLMAALWPLQLDPALLRPRQVVLWLCQLALALAWTHLVEHLLCLLAMAPWLVVPLLCTLAHQMLQLALAVSSALWVALLPPLARLCCNQVTLLLVHLAL